MNSEPAGPTIHVLASVVRRENRWLLCRRPEFKRHGSLWEFPGGKIERGENFLEAARRELREELGVSVVSVGERLFACSDPGSQYLIEFVEVEFTGEPKAIEHTEIRWVTKEELKSLPLAPADAQFARQRIVANPQN